jgi:hypothetical protein
MSEKPEIQVSLTREDYAARRRVPPASMPVPMPPAKPKPQPTLTERIDDKFERRGLRDIGVRDAFKRFALLPDSDQIDLLNEASAEVLGRLLQHARPKVRRHAIQASGHVVRGQV